LRNVDGGAALGLVEEDAARRDPPLLGQDAHDRLGGHRLAGAGFPDEGDGAAGRDVEGDTVKRTKAPAAIAREIDGEIADTEQYAVPVLPSRRHAAPPEATPAWQVSTLKRHA